MEILSLLSGIPAQIKTLSADIDAIQPEVQKILDFVDNLAKIGETFGALAGPYGPEVVGASTVVDKIIQGVEAANAAHVTAVQGGADVNQSQTALTANIAQVVAQSGVIKNTETTAQVGAIAAQVKAENNAPEIGLQG
jgi:hypothetical protein